MLHGPGSVGTRWCQISQRQFALAEAKLAGRCVPADVRLVESAGALYARTAPQKDLALLGAGGLTLRAEPLRPEATTASHDPIERSM